MGSPLLAEFLFLKIHSLTNLLDRISVANSILNLVSIGAGRYSITTRPTSRRPIRSASSLSRNDLPKQTIIDIR